MGLFSHNQISLQQGPNPDLTLCALNLYLLNPQALLDKQEQKTDMYEKLSNNAT